MIRHKTFSSYLTLTMFVSRQRLLCLYLYAYAVSFCIINVCAFTIGIGSSRTHAHRQHLLSSSSAITTKLEENFQSKSKLLRKKIVNGVKVAPAVVSLPLYGLTFAVFGPKTVWRFSKWIYGQANPSNDVLAAHFDRMTAYLYSGKKIASQKLMSYKIHPLFAGLSMITTALLAFVDHASYSKILTYEQLILLNAVICFVSALAAFPLSKLMIGNLHAKKWIVIQGKLSMLYAALSLCPGSIGRVMIHLNWALLFASGAIERVWILCIMTQLDIPDRKTFLKFYSPQMKVAALGAIPLGLVTYFIRG